VAPRRKTLVQLVQDGTFAARMDRELLEGPDVPWPALAALQSRYRAEGAEFARRAVAREFERLVRLVHAEVDRRVVGARPRGLVDELAKLGPARSYKQLEAFFPWAFRHYKGASAGDPFRLELFQRRFLREFWRRRPDGRRVYQVGLFGVPKGSGKTPLAAGLGLYTLVTEMDAPEVFGIAGSKAQAGIAQEFANAWAEEGPLATVLRPGRSIRSTEHRGFYRVLSSDGRLAQGVNPSAGIVDEWWLFGTARERETYNALAKALHKRSGQSWLLAITTAGWGKDSQLGETFDRAIAHPRLEVRDQGFFLVLRDEESGFLMHWYGLPEGRGDELDIANPSVVRRCNPAPWVDPHDLIAELHRPDTDELDWRRLHLNQWTKTRDAWLPAGCWPRARAEGLRPPEGAELWLGVDVGLYSDSTAVAWAWRMEDARIGLGAKVWSAVREVPAHFYVDQVVELESIEYFIQDLAHRYRVREVAYDPRYFARSAELLGKRGLVTVEFMQASAPMADAYQRFYAAAREGRIAHDGDPVFSAHVEATAADMSERGWKVRKLKSSSRIDALVAAVMAHARAAVSGPVSYLITADDLGL
jgi:phage terminase large subunit-like protein